MYTLKHDSIQSNNFICFMCKHVDIRYVRKNKYVFISLILSAPSLCCSLTGKFKIIFFMTKHHIISRQPIRLYNRTHS